MKIWIVADLHLGHRRLCDGSMDNHFRRPNFEWRGFEAWDAVVGTKDIVYILGNVSYGSPRRWFEHLKSRPGEKVLVCGDRETKHWSWYKRAGMRYVIEQGAWAVLNTDYGSVMLSHLPAFPSVLTQQEDMRWKKQADTLGRGFSYGSHVLNIHGHTMGLGMEDHRSEDASSECIGEAPVLLEQLIDKHFRRYGK